MRQGLSPFSMCNRTVSYGKDFTSPNLPVYFSCGFRVRCSCPLTLDYRGQGHQMGFPVSASSCGCCCNCSAGPRATFAPSATYRRTCSTAHLHNTPDVSRSINSPSTGFSSLNSSIVARVRFTPRPPRAPVPSAAPFSSRQLRPVLLHLLFPSSYPIRSPALSTCSLLIYHISPRIISTARPCRGKCRNRPNRKRAVNFIGLCDRATGTRCGAGRTFAENLNATLAQYPFISYAAGYALLVHVFEEGKAILAAGVEHGAYIGHGNRAVLVQVGHYAVG